MIIDQKNVTSLDEWLDDNVSSMYQKEPLAQDWARVAKLTEEVGECTQALIGITGQNPRKGYQGTVQDLLDELVDVLITSILAIQHFTKDSEYTQKVISKRWEYRINKAVLPNV